MGLKQDLIEAKEKAARDTGITKPLDTSDGSFIEREAEYTKEAIVRFYWWWTCSAAIYGKFSI